MIMKIIKNYNDFNMINEKKLYIYGRVFRVADLIEVDEEDEPIYSPIQISNWMKEFNFDLMAKGIFVSTRMIKSDSELFGMRVSSKDIKNKKYFDSNTKDKKGTLIKGSEIIVGKDKLTLYVFQKNSSDKKRARQNHGFKYESMMRKYNNINKPPYTAKWDAEGSIGEELFKVRTEEGKKIEFFDGNTLKNITWDSLEPYYKSDFKWNIKCIKKGNAVDLGAFSRIAGLDSLHNPLTTDVDTFLFDVCFYTGENKENKTEYFIYIDLATWKTYLPEYNEEEIKAMFIDLKQHKLIGERTDEKEIAWKSYTNKYSKITENSLIKLRFKRDSKGQLRIQSAFGHKSFINTLLKENNYIKIS